MILACPNCQTRFQVDDAALAVPGGREVQCGKCGHRWRSEPSPAPVTAPIVEPVRPDPIRPDPIRPVPIRPVPNPVAERPEPVIAAPRADPIRTPPPPPLPPNGPRPESSGPVQPDLGRPNVSSPPTPPARRKRGSGLGLLVVLLLFTAVIGGAVLARDEIVALWPPAAMIYRQAGLKTEPLGTGLEIAKVTPTRGADALTIEGDITNTTSRPITVPKLRVALRDAYLKELASKVIDPPVTRLLPGESAHFKTPFDHPSDAATDVAVTFTATS